MYAVLDHSRCCATSSSLWTGHHLQLGRVIVRSLNSKTSTDDGLLAYSLTNVVAVRIHSDDLDSRCVPLRSGEVKRGTHRT